MTFEKWWNGEEANRIAEGGDQWGLASAAWGAAEENRERAAPQWTRDLPTAVGWYWWKTSPSERVLMLEVYGSPAGLLVSNNDTRASLEKLAQRFPHSEWCGPLEAPSE